MAGLHHSQGGGSLDLSIRQMFK